MKKSKKWIAGLAVLTTAVGLVGCSSTSASGGGSASGDTIQIGADFEMTGSVASFGKSQLNGINLAVKEINAAGGVLGKKIVIDSMDNSSKTDESTRVADKLITQDKVVALIGATTSGDTLAAVNIADDKKTPLLTASATNPDVTVNPKTQKVNDYVFRSCFIDPFQGKVMADFSTKKLNAKTAVVYTDVASDYSKGLAKYFEQTFAADGGTIVDTENYQTGDTDFNAVLTRIKSKHPDVIYVPGYYQEVGKIVKQARAMGITVPMEGGDGWDAPQLVDIAGAQALENTYISNHYAVDDPDPNVQKFVKAYESAYNLQPDAMAVLGYDAMYMLADSIKRAGAVDKEKIKDALAATQNFTGVTGSIKLDQNHDPVKAAVILAYKNGKQVYKDKIQP